MDGSSKDFKGLSADERALLNAGELVAFQRGRRPMCMVQLWTGWNDDEVGDQNIDLPYVVRLLREVIEDEKIEAITTALSQGKSLGECLLAAETAEASRSVEEQAAAAAAAEARATETPQERAAREREEMAARGKF